MTPGALFGTAVIAPIIVLIVLMILLSGSTSYTAVLFTVAIIFTLPITGFIVWLYAIATYFHTKLPSDVYINLTRFKIFLAVPYISNVLIVVLMPFMINLMDNMDEQYALLIAMFVILFYFPVFCIAHSIFFALKIMTSAEKQDPAKFGDFAPDFVWAIFFPIGLFWVQPKINKAFEHFES